MSTSIISCEVVLRIFKIETTGLIEFPSSILELIAYNSLIGNNKNKKENEDKYFMVFMIFRCIGKCTTYFDLMQKF